MKKNINLYLLLCLITTNSFNNIHLQAQTNTNISLKLIKEEIRKPSEKKQAAIKGRKLYTPNLELIGYEQFSEDSSKSYIETVEGNRFEVAPYKHTRVANKGNTIVKIGATPEQLQKIRAACISPPLTSGIAFYNASGKELKNYKEENFDPVHYQLSKDGYLVTYSRPVKKVQKKVTISDLPEEMKYRNSSPPNVYFNGLTNKLVTFESDFYLTLYAPNGEKLWRKAIKEGYSNDILIDDNAQTITILCSNHNNEVTLLAFNKDGSLRFKYNTLATRVSHYFLANDQYIAIHGLNGLCLIDSSNGKLIWENKTPFYFYEKTRKNTFRGIGTNKQNDLIILVTRGKYVGQKLSEITHYEDWIQLLDIKTGKVVFKYNLGQQVRPSDDVIKMIEIIDDKHFKINGKNKSYYFEIEKK